MKIRRYSIAALVVLIPPLAAAQPAAPAQRACLRFGEIYSWKAIDDRTLIIEDNWHKKFRVALMGHCPGLQFKERVALRSPGSSDLSCMTPGDDVVVNQTGTGPQRCSIRSITGDAPASNAANASGAR